MRMLQQLAIIVFLNSLVGFSAPATVLASNSTPKPPEHAAVEKVLNKYLECRRKGDYKCCSESLTSDYLKRFSTENKMQYVDFYKSTETHYHDAKAIRFNRVGDNLTEVTVESYSEEPGVLSRDIEVYSIRNISGSWKIDGVSTKESEAIKEIGSDGKWKDVNK